MGRWRGCEEEADEDEEDQEKDVIVPSQLGRSMSIYVVTTISLQPDLV
jgi:hypothetical protein